MLFLSFYFSYSPSSFSLTVCWLGTWNKAVSNHLFQMRAGRQEAIECRVTPDERSQWLRDRRRLNTSLSLCKFTAIPCKSVQVKSRCETFHLSSSQDFRKIFSKWCRTLFLSSSLHCFVIFLSVLSTSTFQPSLVLPTPFFFSWSLASCFTSSFILSPTYPCCLSQSHHLSLFVYLSVSPSLWCQAMLGMLLARALWFHHPCLALWYIWKELQ